MEYFGLKLGQDLGNRAAYPYQTFRGVPPPPPGPLASTDQKYQSKLVSCGSNRLGETVIERVLN